MGRRRKEKYVEVGVAGVIIVGLIIYAALSILYWLVIGLIGAMILFISYYFTKELIDELWIKILVWITATMLVILLGAGAYSAYPIYDKSVRGISIDTAQNLSLMKSNKGNYKVVPDYEGMIQNGVNSNSTGALVEINKMQSDGIKGAFNIIVDTIRDAIIRIFNPNYKK